VGLEGPLRYKEGKKERKNMLVVSYIGIELKNNFMIFQLLLQIFA
jgi:hypothetical protein